VIRHIIDMELRKYLSSAKCAALGKVTRLACSAAWVSAFDGFGAGYRPSSTMWFDIPSICQLVDFAVCPCKIRTIDPWPPPVKRRSVIQRLAGGR